MRLIGSGPRRPSLGEALTGELTQRQLVTAQLVARSAENARLPDWTMMDHKRQEMNLFRNRTWMALKGIFVKIALFL